MKMQFPARNARTSASGLRVTLAASLLAFALVAPASSALASDDHAQFGPTAASDVNYARYAGWSPLDLHAAFPCMCQHELDLLVFRIADKASMAGTAHES